MRAFKAQGLLDPVLDYLDREIKRLMKPIEPQGAEWPYLRARQDGGVAIAEKLKQHLITRSKPAPDEAENTED